jgi:hypothetical protein
MFAAFSKTSVRAKEPIFAVARRGQVIFKKQDVKKIKSKNFCVNKF